MFDYETVRVRVRVRMRVCVCVCVCCIWAAMLVYVPSDMWAQRRFWSESSLGAFWVASEAKFLYANKENSNQPV